MFLRGFGMGCAMMAALWWWLRQKMTATPPVYHRVQSQSVDRAATARQATQILHRIQKEQSWILKPNEKPSTDL